LPFSTSNGGRSRRDSTEAALPAPQPVKPSITPEGGPINSPPAIAAPPAVQRVEPSLNIEFGLQNGSANGPTSQPSTAAVPLPVPCQVEPSMTLEIGPTNLSSAIATPLAIRQVEPPVALENIQDNLCFLTVEPLARQGRFLHDAETPMVLCDICKKLSVAELFRNTVQTHQPSYMELVVSALSGCGLCTLFLNSTLNSYSGSFGCSVHVAHEALKGLELRGPCKIHLKRGTPDEIWLDVPYTEDKARSDSSRFFIDPEDKIATPNGSALSLRALNADVLTAPATSPHSSDSDLMFHPDDIEGFELTRFPNFVIPKSWIRCCVEQHPNCLSYKGDPPLPTRVIDIGPVDVTKEPCLLISNGRKAPFVALSHCWGTTQPLVTDVENLQQHLISIPFSSLPRLFQDAVTATRSLGYRYLWIDSLCIIQDSTEDWQRECSRMVEVYRNSTVTIVGPAAFDSYTGFLDERIPSNSEPHIWECQSREGAPPHRVTLRWDRYAKDHKTIAKEYPGAKLTEIERRSPLEERAWALQERLLSSRILYFGPQRMYWECNTLTRFEGWKSSTPSLGKGIPKNQLSGLDTHDDRQKIWYGVVTEYSRRLLTRSMDKLPALSGMVNLIWSGCEEGYVGGLIKDDLCRGLSWFAEYNTRTLHRTEPSAYRGPSWSWVSTDYPILFWSLGRDIGMGLQRMGATKWRGVCNIVEEKSYALKRRNKVLDGAKLRILDAQVETAGEYRFGLILSGKLKVNGRLKKGWLRPGLSQGRSLSNWLLSESRYYDYKGDFFPDDPEWWSLYGTEREILCLFIDRYRSGWYGLAIEPLETGSNTYRRIGLLTQSENLARTHYRHPFWFEDAPEQEIELI
jgi:hypothetical protein